MQFVARAVCASLATFFFLCLEGRAAVNKLACPSPPGGFITCEADLEPSCKSGDGVTVEGFCFQLKSSSEPDRLAELLSRVLGREIRPQDLGAYKLELRRGWISEGDATVTFRSRNYEESAAREPESPSPPAPSLEGESPARWSCKACVIHNEKSICAEGAGASRDDAIREASQQLARKISMAGDIRDPEVSCERQ